MKKFLHCWKTEIAPLGALVAVAGIKESDPRQPIPKDCRSDPKNSQLAARGVGLTGDMGLTQI